MTSPGSRRDHDRFCQIEGWTTGRNARGQKVAHHITYELGLPDGRILRTRISRPADGTTYGAGLWRHILKTQLEVTDEDFCRCVSGGVPPDRGATGPGSSARALPASLAYQLIHDAGLPEEEVAGMTAQQAAEIMAAFWSRPPSGG